ncbi:hypothetical protein KFE25_003612 [Diacronema lutheri]|uniref:Uncharacterized protein n=1 Tax=Diacronema lutheri TaxID=2081491 RepID=A0A8J5X7F0_DIALT|nr:hypothetical protein KFE25_003612 [Diacronema lutheri]
MAAVFHGLPAPEGVERRTLYASKFRTIFTYRMNLADLDLQLQRLLADRSWAIRLDERVSLTGKLDVSNDGRVVHVSMEPCNNPMFSTMKYWIDM